MKNNKILLPESIQHVGFTKEEEESGGNVNISNIFTSPL